MNLASNCRQPGLPSKVPETGTPSACTLYWVCFRACNKSAAWLSSSGKPFSLLIEVEVGVDAWGVLDPELAFSCSSAVAISRWSCGTVGLKVEERGEKNSNSVMNLTIEMSKNKINLSVYIH